MESLAVGHHRRGHDVTVATLLFDHDTSHPFVEALERNGVRVYPMRMAPRAYLRERREVAKMCRDLRPDVVHTHGYRIDLLDRRVVARMGVPTVTTVHGASKTGGLKGAFFEWLQRRNYRRFDAVVAVSRHLYDTTLSDGVSPDRLRLIPNAWGGHHPPLTRQEARRELRLDESSRVVGWVGRFIPVKGGDIFIDALSRMEEPRPTALLIGYGPEGERLQRRATELGVADSVRLLTDIRDAGRYFAAFDTYVLSSRSEGLPIVILEAMAARTPIVASRVGGVPDALGEADAWLVPPEDPRALAAAIGESLENRELATRRADNARTRLDRDYSLEVFLDSYEDVYRMVAGRHAV